MNSNKRYKISICDVLTSKTGVKHKWNPRTTQAKYSNGVISSVSHILKINSFGGVIGTHNKIIEVDTVKEEDKGELKSLKIWDKALTTQQVRFLATHS